MQWLMLQQESPEDYVIATGYQCSVREFVRMSALELGIELEFRDEGVNEYAVVLSKHGDDVPGVNVGDCVVKVDSRYFRPTEVETLLGDSTKAREKLGWKPEISLDNMVREMVAYDLEQAKRHALLKHHGYDIRLSRE
jgi:GDPmannose 4,6-dehydratase